MEEGAVVCDGAGFWTQDTLLLLDDAVQLHSCVSGVAAVPVLLHQTPLDALPGAADVLEV